VRRADRASRTDRPGRKPGSKNRLGESFIAAIASDFSLHGEGVIEQVRVERPEIWLKIVSDLLPKEAEAKIAGAGSTFFAGCETMGEIVAALLGELEIGEALELCDVLRAELLKVASDEAQPVE
jgi:hypothetical protein